MGILYPILYQKHSDLFNQRNRNHYSVGPLMSDSSGKEKPPLWQY